MQKLYLFNKLVLAVYIGCVTALFVGKPHSATAAPNVLVLNVNITYSNGDPVPNGTYRMDFVMYDDPLLGTPSDGIHDVWHELNKSAEVADGGLVIALGNQSPLPDLSLIPSYYIDYRIEGDAFLSSRLPLSDYPYQIGSGQVDGLGSAQLLQLSQGLQTDTSSVQTSLAVNKTAAGSGFVDLQRNGTSVFTISNDGGALLTPLAGATALTIQSSGATSSTMFVADTGTNQIKVGDDTATSSSEVTLFVVDSAPSVDAPSGVNGGLYYDQSLAALQCYEANEWRQCVSTLQTAYDKSADGAVVLSDDKNYTITTIDSASDPEIIFNLDCATCSGTEGRYAIQRNGTDIFTILPDGSMQRVALAGKNITTEIQSGSSLQYIATEEPNTDMLQISNASQPITTNGVNGVYVDYHGGNGAIEASGMRLDYTPGGTTGATWNGLKISSKANAATGVNNYGIVLEGPASSGAGQETALKITTGWDLGIDIGSGGLQLAAQEDPEAPTANYLKIYAKKISGRMLIKAMGPSGVNYPLQPSLFQNQVTMINAQSGTANGLFGTNRTVAGTASHPNADEVFGYMTNYATNATSGADAGVSNNSTQFFRGSVPGANGYFFNTRIGLPDASYPSTRMFVGMTSQTTVQSLASDNPNSHRSGFSFSTNRGDTNWQFTTRDGTTETLADTGLPMVAGKVYDIFVYVPPQGTTIYWRIDNITDTVSAEGAATDTLPAGDQAMRGSVGLTTLSATTRNIRMQRMYIEADR